MEFANNVEKRNNSTDDDELDKKIVKLNHSISKIDTSLQTKKEILRTKISKTYSKIETTRKVVNNRSSSSGTPSPRINRNRYSSPRNNSNSNDKLKIQELEKKLEETKNELNMIKKIFNNEKGKLGRTISSQRLRIIKLEKNNNVLKKQLKEQPFNNNSNNMKNSSIKINKASPNNKSSPNVKKITRAYQSSPTKYIIIRKQVE